jgi:hypothetical protein
VKALGERVDRARAGLHFWWQRKLCQLTGRHDFEPTRVVDGWVHLECFYCGHGKASRSSGSTPST